jgi:hypothetical protein
MAGKQGAGKKLEMKVHLAYFKCAKLILPKLGLNLFPKEIHKAVVIKLAFSSNMRALDRYLVYIILFLHLPFLFTMLLNDSMVKYLKKHFFTSRSGSHYFSIFLI